MLRIRSRIVLCGLSVALATCMHRSQVAGVAGARGSGAPGATPLPTPAGQPVTAKSTANMARKRITGKEEPATLIAADHSQCTVTSERFRNTKVGDKALCDWRVGDRQP